ncbi:hypothetical protein [Sporosarcina sp. Te-1]|uniref:hypothetical protein n=1 Tax=Sporosarcina sp. Te-1 TaxID=2818390 RepID=UPI001A9F420B|nr:hypothetical protein [Sporosarcina sp. Te-1]QTD40292.1 hypothetical protein J3U78_16080 [Sporosarcina sp. Te-1]
MKTFYKIILSFIIVISILPSAKTFAHSCTSFGESFKYWIDCNNHTDTAIIKFNLGVMDATYKGYVTSGAKMWNDSGLVLISETTTYSRNFIHTYSDFNSGYTAVFYNYESNSSGHLQSWAVGMNTAEMDDSTAAQNRTTMAHEFGHVLGLNDLSQTTNRDTLMYKNRGSRTVTSPTSWDTTGVKKILGQ